jgi:hypothetical protein
MKTIANWDALREFGIIALTRETQYLLCHTAMRLPAGTCRLRPF